MISSVYYSLKSTQTLYLSYSFFSCSLDADRNTNLYSHILIDLLISPVSKFSFTHHSTFRITHTVKMISFHPLDNFLRIQLTMCSCDNSNHFEEGFLNKSVTQLTSCISYDFLSKLLVFVFLLFNFFGFCGYGGKVPLFLRANISFSNLNVMSLCV